jgi:predicted small lipoprotein YifL
VILIVKSVPDLPRFAAIFIVALLAGCGQKGPLYLPEKPAPVATPATQQTPPAPADSTTPASK